MTRRRLLFLACVLALGGCAAPYQAVPPAADRSLPALPPVLDVRNDHWSPMKVFLVRPGFRFFLGEVEPGERGTFPIPRDLLLGGDVRVHAEARGAAVDHVTEPLRFAGGHYLELRLAKNLYSSRIRVR